MVEYTLNNNNPDISKRIDRDSYEPAYAQLANILREQVAKGIYQPGQRLPSEAILCKSYNVSPMTVRRAINLLIDQGVVNTIQGKGTFVKPLNFSAISFNLHNFQELFQDKGRTKIRFLEARIIRADEQVAAKIEIKTGQRVIFMRRLIISNGEPMIYHKESMLYDPRLPIVEGEMELTSLHGLFSGSNESSFKKGKLELKATILDQEAAHLLKSVESVPALKLEHIFYDFDNRPISWGWFIFRSDLPELSTTVGIWE
jgi:GntR family transcriptional regulator